MFIVVLGDFMRIVLLIMSAVLLSGCSHQVPPVEQRTHISYKDLPPVTVRHSQREPSKLATLKQRIPVYSKSCGCPDQKVNGRKCGGNSAASRSGGNHVLCAIDRMSVEQIEDAKRKYGSLLFQRKR